MTGVKHAWFHRAIGLPFRVSLYQCLLPAGGVGWSLVTESEDEIAAVPGSVGWEKSMRRRLVEMVWAACVLLVAGLPLGAQQPDDAFVGQMAPALKVGQWFNSEPLTFEGLRGKVVLLDFWAWDCPECAEAMPYVIDWHENYADDGLVVIGVHTPRIDYEKDITRLQETMEERGVEYAVATDHEYLTWLDYLNAAWPTHFVVDQEGIIQMNHTGTGRYEETEALIQRLLGVGD
jgi:thiol-disulfide isomerase/thioredoxin